MNESPIHPPIHQSVIGSYRIVLLRFSASFVFPSFLINFNFHNTHADLILSRSGKGNSRETNIENIASGELLVVIMIPGHFPKCEIANVIIARQKGKFATMTFSLAATSWIDSITTGVSRITPRTSTNRGRSRRYRSLPGFWFRKKRQHCKFC